MTLRTVVLPAPFGPMTLVIWPGCAAKLRLVAAFIPPKAMLTPDTSSDGGLPADRILVMGVSDHIVVLDAGICIASGYRCGSQANPLGSLSFF
jgi:hypothetical protein